MRATFRFILLASIFPLASAGCGPSHQYFLARVFELSGAQAVDCGYVAIGSDLTSSLACFEAQLAGSQPFRVVVETYGLENICPLAVVRDANGQLKHLLYDPDACNHNCWFKRPRLWEGDCPDPHIARNPDGSFSRRPIQCTRERPAN